MARTLMREHGMEVKEPALARGWSYDQSSKMYRISVHIT